MQPIGTHHDLSRPESGAEIIWFALSFLSLPLDEQRERIEGSAESSPRLLDADLLPYVIEAHTVEWQEEFAPCPAFLQLLSALARLGGPTTYVEFLDGGPWHEIRKLSAEALAESNLTPWDLRDAVSLTELVEVHAGTPRVLWSQ
jgi:hypothetical protein